MLQRRRSGTSSSSANGDEDEDADGELCAICLEQIQDPVMLRCSHTFCKGCLEIYREARGWVAERCPLCRRRLADHVSRNWKNGTWILVAFLLVLLILLSQGTFYLLLLYW